MKRVILILFTISGAVTGECLALQSALGEPARSIGNSEVAPSDASPVGEVSQYLEPIVIEADKSTENIEPPKTIQVPAGVGMKEIDPILNELAIEQQSMERLEDVADERRNDGWWLDSEPSSSWKTQGKFDFSLNQKLKARTYGTLLGKQAELEGGFFHDHRRIIYMENSNNPYDDSTNRLNTYPNRQDGGYFKLSLSEPSQSSMMAWKSLMDFDFQSEDVYAGQMQTGEKKGTQGSLNAAFRAGSWTVKPFVQARRGQFDSKIDLYRSNFTNSVRWGAQLEWNKIRDFSITNSISKEAFTRNRADGSVAQFGRIHDKVSTSYYISIIDCVELRSHFFLELARDEISGDSNPNHSSLDALWDGGVEVSSTHRFPFGWNLKARRFSLLPSPSQRFGDGALLEGSPHLPMEKGIRVSTGPWWQSSHFTFGLSGFTEESQDSPLMVAVSPTTVRTLPLGGVWTRGVLLEGLYIQSGITLRSTFTYQDAVNASQINWQQGQQIPGRPKYVFQNEAEYTTHGFKVGARHSYKSRDALDLSGLWFQAAQYRIDTWVGYGKKTWEVRLAANNLIPNFELPQGLTFQGSAAPNLLEPNIQQRELRLQCEFVI